MQTPQISAERWIANLLEVAKLISDQEYQDSRWLAPDALAWETPDEVINSLDDCGLNGFIEQFAESFSPLQSRAAAQFRDAMERYCKMTPPHLEAQMVLADPSWRIVREKAAVFVEAFESKWPENLT